jgi:hypothetical protein
MQMKIFAAVSLIMLPLGSQVRFSGSDPIKVEVDGKPFTELHKGAEERKPFLFPIFSSTGKMVTRGYPMQNIEGESRDHPHHRGLFFTYDDVNGVKFWESDPLLQKENMGTVVIREVKTKPGQRTGTLSFVADWKDPKGKTQLVESRTMTFFSDPKLRTIDFDITLTAPAKVVFGDTKEGSFGLRLPDSMTEKKKGGHMVNAEGQTGMDKVWGHRSNWVDYSGTVDGETLGVAMFDHPSNPRHPTYWHARDYGLFALNPFGQQAFDKNQPESHWVLEEGKSLRFRWRVVVHPGDAESAKVADLYKEYAK